MRLATSLSTAETRPMLRASGRGDTDPAALPFSCLLLPPAAAVTLLLCWSSICDCMATKHRSVAARYFDKRIDLARKKLDMIRIKLRAVSRSCRAAIWLEKYGC